MGTGEDQKLAAIVPRNYCTREIGARQEESAKAAPDGRSCDVKGAYTRPCKVPVDEQRPKASLVLLCRGFRVRLSVPPLTAYMVALVICVLIRRAQPRRSRYVSARTKRQAIARHENETGKTFKRGRDELDHILPHSWGGGNSEDNIQVLPKKKNREKGARLRWWE